MTRILLLLAASALALLSTSCVISSPQTRIDRDYSLYQSLPPKHQELVQRGEIAEGMSKSAVYLAWGNPSRKVQGHRDDADFERWDYTRLQPHYYNRFYTHFGHGYGRRGRYYHSYGFAPSIEYVPYRSASVKFRSGTVESWERLGPYRY